MKRYRLCGKRVTDSSQAVIYLFSRLGSNRHIPCVQWERATLPILNHDTTDVFPVFRPVLSKGASKEKTVWHLWMYKCCYKFWLWIFLFCNLFIQNFFFNIFFPQFFFFTIFFQNFSFKICFSNFFSKNFLPTLFQNFFFEGLTLDASPFIETKQTVSSVLWKIRYTASGRNWTLVSCDKVLFFDLYC